MEKQYVILSTERTFMGQYAMWWLQSRHGYGVDIGCAGLFDEAEAREIVQDARGKEFAFEFDKILHNSEYRYFDACAWVDVMHLDNLDTDKADIKYDPIHA